MANDESSLAKTPEQDVEVAAGAVTNILAAADGGTERAQIVGELNDELADSGVVIVDVNSNPSERRGARTNLTHDQLVDALAMARQQRAIRAARALGRRAI